MAKTGFFHHVGTFLLFVATLLLIITSVTVPTVGQISMLRVVLQGANTTTPSNSSSTANSTNVAPSISFGSFGYCVDDAFTFGSHYCSDMHIGYNATTVITGIDATTNMTGYNAETSNSLTQIMVLHPVAALMAFFSFLLAAGAGMCGSFMAAFMTLFTFLVTLVALVTDFVTFGMIRNAVYGANNGSYAQVGNGAWALLAACVAEFVAMLIVFVTCCSARWQARRARHRKAAQWESGPPPAAPGTNGRRWI